MELTYTLIICGIALAVVFCFCLAVANFAPERFFDIFNKINGEEMYANKTTKEFVEEFNAREFSSLLRLHETPTVAGDAYVQGGDLILSTNTLTSTGVASYATLAHELGHALQDRDSKKLTIKRVLHRISAIIGPFMFPAFIVGIILSAFGGDLLYYGIALGVFGFLIFFLSVILKLFTIAIEKDASKKAIKLLQEYLDIDKKQLKMAKKLLNSAKLTYWGSLFQTLLGWTFLTRNRKFYKN